MLLRGSSHTVYSWPTKECWSRFVALLRLHAQSTYSREEVMADRFQDVAAVLTIATSPDTYLQTPGRAWTRFDPSKAELIDIARAIESGTV